MSPVLRNARANAKKPGAEPGLAWSDYRLRSIEIDRADAAGRAISTAGRRRAVGRAAEGTRRDALLGIDASLGGLDVGGIRRLIAGGAVASALELDQLRFHFGARQGAIFAGVGECRSGNGRSDDDGGNDRLEHD
ncbi:hypothetical protein BURKHO8Y_210363 [Burkholderia sp. 8Y]|nr:hypothetical protein BURKHO8Y_210363 [Burkholderia sp. 8Y]